MKTIIFLLSTQLYANVRYLDLFIDETGTINVKDGITTTLSFSKEIEIADVGDKNLIEIQVSKSFKEVILRSKTSQPGILTNLIVKSDRIYTFTLISSPAPDHVVYVNSKSKITTTQKNTKVIPQPVLKDPFPLLRRETSERFLTFEVRPPNIYVEIDYPKSKSKYELNEARFTLKTSKYIPVQIQKVFIFEDRKVLGFLLKTQSSENLNLKIPLTSSKTYREFYL